MASCAVSARLIASRIGAIASGTCPGAAGVAGTAGEGPGAPGAAAGAGAVVAAGAAAEADAVSGWRHAARPHATASRAVNGRAGGIGRTRIGIGNREVYQRRK